MNTTTLLWLGAPLNTRPSLAEALWLNHTRTTHRPLPLWALAANRRGAARPLPLTTRAHTRMHHTSRPWARLRPAVT